MIINDQLLLWNHASIKVLDVRHSVLRAGEAVQSYRLPTSVFLFATRGEAYIKLDEEKHVVQRFQIIHSGKGTMLDIFLAEEEFEYYMIYYKASLPLTLRPDLVALFKHSNPFQLQYRFLPTQPLSIFRIIKDMEREWRVFGYLERFQIKSLFYQFVSFVLPQIHRQGIEMKAPDPALQAMLYIEEHYAEPITLESLAEILSYSIPQLSVLFKKKTGYSVIDYVIRKRIEYAKTMLTQTDATVKEIAASVGYKDSFYFGRIFKKVVGISPAQYRAHERNERKAEDSPSLPIRSSIALDRLWRYIGDDNHCQFRHNREGRTLMSKQSKSVTVATLTLCLALLISACSSHAPNLQSPSEGNQSSSATTTTPQSSAQTKTKFISTINGDIEIPEHPTRIVADQYLGSFIALGVIPIGAPGLHRQNPYLAEALKAVDDTGDVTGSLEKVVELQPDLIVTGDNQNRYESLSKIAPTISIPYGNLKNAHEELTYFGKLLGKEKEAEAWLADYDQRIAAAKEKVKMVIPENATFSILESVDKNTFAYGDNFGRGGQAVYQALGLKPPAAVAKDIFDKQWAELSNELLPKYAGDYIILTSNDRTIEDLKVDPIWSTLDAVKNNRIYIWKEERSWYYDPIAVLSQTEEIAAWLTKVQ